MLFLVASLPFLFIFLFFFGYLQLLVFLVCFHLEFHEVGALLRAAALSRCYQLAYLLVNLTFI